MSYYANGKTHTDHPLMDEICYNCKRILKSIVIKNDVLANSKETSDSITNAEMYFIYKEDGYISFELFQFNYEILYAYYGDSSKAAYYEKYKQKIPEEDRDALTLFANQYFIDNFVEQNDYYRMLIGLPPIGGEKSDGTNEYDIWLVDTDIPSGFSGDFDPTKPLHKQSKYLIQVLYTYGVIDKLRETYVGSNYSYMFYLADRSIDLYTARKAAKWDILYMPNVYYLIEDKFKEVYAVNRAMYSNRSYQEFFKQTGEYYDQMMILMVLAETFANLVTDTPEWYIRRDIFDLKSCQYFMDSYGVEFFSIIPLKYQIRIVKKLNELVKFKSSNENFADIIDIFDKNIFIYKYWLFKDYDKSSGTYDLKFISSLLNDSYDEYIEDANHRFYYDDITLQDKYWDGEDTHEYVKECILDQDFTVRGTKYMSVEYHVSLSEYLYQMSYMLGTILDSKVDIKDITIGVPSIDDTANFKLSNLFLFLVILTNIYYRVNDTDANTAIKYPSNMSTGSEPTINEDYYDYKKKYFPEFYVTKNGRIFGFNTKLDKTKLRTELQARHSYFRFGQGDTENATTLVGDEYLERANENIDKLMLDDFIVGGDFDSIEELMDYYNTNTEVYDNLKDCRVNAANDDQKKALDYVFQEMFTREYDKDYYILEDGTYATDLLQILAERDYILYRTYLDIMEGEIAEDNLESRQELIRSMINDIVDTLDYYFYNQGVDSLCSFTTTESFFSIIQYVYLMINFFKSFKVYFLDPYVTFESDDVLENSARASDNIEELRFRYWKWDKLQSQDVISGIRAEEILKDEAFDIKTRDIVDIYSHNEDDPLSDYNYDGMNAEKGELEDYYTIDGDKASELAAPYVTVNGGASYLGMLDWENIDGGDSYEYPNRDYFSINGGNAYDPYVKNTDAMGSQMFNYVIDGGSSNGRYFLNNSLEIYFITKAKTPNNSDPGAITGSEEFDTDPDTGNRIISGTQLFANAIIDERMNGIITIEEDGINISDSALLSTEEFNNVVTTMEDFRDKVKTEGVKAKEEIEVLKDEDALLVRIQTITNKITYNMEYTNAQMRDNYFVKRNKATVDDMLSTQLLSKVDTNPYSWEELD